MPILSITIPDQNTHGTDERPTIRVLNPRQGSGEIKLAIEIHTQQQQQQQQGAAPHVPQPRVTRSIEYIDDATMYDYASPGTAREKPGYVSLAPHGVYPTHTTAAGYMAMKNGVRPSLPVLQVAQSSSHSNPTNVHFDRESGRPSSSSTSPTPRGSDHAVPAKGTDAIKAHKQKKQGKHTESSTVESEDEKHFSLPRDRVRHSVVAALQSSDPTDIPAKTDLIDQHAALVSAIHGKLLERRRTQEALTVGKEKSTLF